MKADMRIKALVVDTNAITRIRGYGVEIDPGMEGVFRCLKEELNLRLVLISGTNETTARLIEATSEVQIFFPRGRRLFYCRLGMRKPYLFCLVPLAAGVRSLQECLYVGATKSEVDGFRRRGGDAFQYAPSNPPCPYRLLEALSERGLMM